MSAPSGTIRSNSDYTFLAKRDYVLDLTQRVSLLHSGERVALVTHDFDLTEPLIAHLLDSVIAAAKRGVHATLVLDARTFPPVPLSRSLQTRTQTTRERLNQLHAAGGVFTVMNTTPLRTLNQLGGRSHIKLAVVNDTVYVGGCNLTRTSYTDVMVRWEDPASATWLYEMALSMARLKQTKAVFHGTDQERTLNATTSLLLDAGTPNQSLILKQALTLIDEAREWVVITCQFFPNSTTMRHLVAAYKRGVKVEIYYNHPSAHRPGYNVLIHFVVAHERLRHPSALFERQLQKGAPFLHAKLLATETGTIVGSHNFVVAGVRFGTAELSLLRRDSTFSFQAVRWLQAQL